ncbi:hypothetical protein B9Z19DRAFT_1132954 [Tuber borchii]|uniref:Uncharacterized protein n=1 Tax=Tuber borchii TaxID=42251 RepID=A0A2T6ZGP9_TUBBO|nr:hypothetical protein B9Z19DRAFT_1132954 [Tuber borchii]
MDCWPGCQEQAFYISMCGPPEAYKPEGTMEGFEGLVHIAEGAFGQTVSEEDHLDRVRKNATLVGQAVLVEALSNGQNRTDMVATGLLDDYLANNEKRPLFIALSPLSPASPRGRRQCKDRGREYWLVSSPVFPALSILAISRISPRNFITSSRITGLIICFGSGIYCIGAERLLEGLSLTVFRGPNMGLELLFSAGKRGNNGGLLGAMLDMSVQFMKRDLGIIAIAAIGALVRVPRYTWDTRGLGGTKGYGRASSAAAHRLLYTHSLRTGSGESSLTSCVAQYPESTYLAKVALQSITLANPQSPGELTSKYLIFAVGLIKARSPLHDSSPYTYAYISLDNVFYEAATGNCSDALEESGVALLLTSSNSIDSCLDSVTAPPSFTTAIGVCLYVYSVLLSYFERKVHINALLVFVVWVGF